MKKFSNVSGSKVGEAPKVEVSKEVNELNQIKYSIMSLMDNLLRVQSYGSARKSILPTTKITGQELFIEALLDLISDKSFKDQIKALESLKSSNRDWESIDEKINLLSEEIQSIKNIQVSKNHISKIKNIIDVYGDDADNFEFMVERYCGKIKSANTAYQRAMAANMMTENSKFKKYSKEKLLIISEKFLKKAKELGQ
jgi:hypothetical protein